MKEAWHLRYEGSSQRIYITAEGYATEPESVRAGGQFRDLLGERAVDLVIDLQKMTGYTSDARRAWQECFFPVRAQLRTMLVVGSPLPVMIRMGVSVVAAFSRIPVRFFPSLTALDDWSRHKHSVPPAAR